MIIQVITNFSELGGAESALIRNINSSKGTPFKVISLMAKNPEMIEKIEHPNCEVIALGAHNVFSLLGASLKLAIIIKRETPIKVFSWMYHANVISALARILSRRDIPLIWGVRHSLDDYQGEKRSTKIAIQLGRFLKNIPDKVVYCSQKAQKQHENFGYNSYQKSVYIPNGYFFSELKLRDFKAKSLILGAAGRFHEAKDYLTLLKTFKRLKSQNLNVELHICGRGIHGQNTILMGMLNSLELNCDDVILLGELDSMAAFYSTVDIFILSSKTEGFPNVLAEAASHGCAVFSTDVGDAPYIINNDDHIAPVKDDEKLADCITKFILLSPDIKKEKVLKTTMHVRKNFSIKTIAKCFLEV